MKKKIISLILGTAMVVSALTGCGGGGNTAGDSAPAETPAPAESSEETAGEAENAGGGDGSESVTLTVLVRTLQPTAAVWIPAYWK